MADVWPVELCGVLMDGETLDADGVRWARNTLTGWDSPAVRLNGDVRTGTHGAWSSRPLYAARELTLSGIAFCPDMATAERVGDRLHGMPGTGSSGVLTVHSAAPKSLTVDLNGELRATWPFDIPNPYVRFQIPLRADDPFKRSTTARTTPVAAGATVTIDNDGTAAADLLVTLTSSGTVVLTAGGVTLTTASLPSGAVIDTGACMVTSSGDVDLFSSVLVPRFPALPAGGGSVHQAGTAGLSIVSHDTFA